MTNTYSGGYVARGTSRTCESFYRTSTAPTFYTGSFGWTMTPSKRKNWKKEMEGQ